MQQLTVADRIWNRACETGGETPHAGDKALAALLLFHGPAMNGGVLHAVECLSSEQLKAAKEGYCFFALRAIAEVIAKAKTFLEGGRDPEDIEAQLDMEYWTYIPDDSTLVKRFELHLQTHPSDFLPLQ